MVSKTPIDQGQVITMVMTCVLKRRLHQCRSVKEVDVHGIKEPTHMFQNCNTNQTLICDA